MDHDIQLKLDMIKEKILKASPGTEAIYLFGSYAYGTPSADSDFDIYVVVPDSTPENPLELSAAVLRELYPGIEVSVDLLIGKRSVFDRRKTLGGTIQKVVSTKGVLIYGRQ